MQSSNLNQIRNILFSIYYKEERRKVILDSRNRLKITLILKYFWVGNNFIFGISGKQEN